MSRRKLRADVFSRLRRFESWEEKKITKSSLIFVFLPFLSGDRRERERARPFAVPRNTPKCGFQNEVATRPTTGTGTAGSNKQLREKSERKKAREREREITNMVSASSSGLTWKGSFVCGIILLRILYDQIESDEYTIVACLLAGWLFFMAKQMTPRNTPRPPRPTVPPRPETPVLSTPTAPTAAPGNDATQEQKISYLLQQTTTSSADPSSSCTPTSRR